MFEFAALTYGVLASFLMTSVARNRRAARGNPPLVTLFGWCLMSFSLVAALLILSYVGYQVMAGAPIEGVPAIA